MFIDEVKVHLRAGEGGSGCLSFRREKFIPKGGPDGGNGGKGGDVIVLCDNNVGDLEAYRWNPHRFAQNGQPGMGRLRAGFDGEPLILRVPPGTQVMDAETGRLVAEVTHPGEQVLLLQGGRGGIGNSAFKNSINQAPRMTTPGKPGETGSFRLSLKTIADLGLVGFPNAGKSSLTRALTSARPKTAPYPFTTLHVNVGVIEYPERHNRIFLADIPGLIEGAHENRGLGHRFLKHIERCTLLIFLLDMAGSENRKPWSDYAVLDRELRMYSKVLAAKPRLVVANKMDLPASAALLEQFSARHSVPIAPISCMTGLGLPELREILWKAVREGKMPPGSIVPAAKPSKAKAPKPRAKAKTKAKPAAKPAARKSKSTKPKAKKPAAKVKAKARSKKR